MHLQSLLGYNLLVSEKGGDALRKIIIEIEGNMES